MKVSQAENLICPFMSDSLPFDVGTITVNGHYCNCITNKCMAWKYTSTHHEFYTEEYTIEEDYRTVIKRRPVELKEDDKCGYCRRLK